MGALPVVEPWEHETTDGPPVPAPFERFTDDYTTFFRRELRSLVALAAAIAGAGPRRGDRPGGAPPGPPRVGPHRPLRQARRLGAAGHHQPGHLVAAPPPSRAARARSGWPPGASSTRRRPRSTSSGRSSGGCPHRQAAAVALYYLDDLSIAEIADALGCAEGTAKAHLHQARRTLADHLRDQEHDR